MTRAVAEASLEAAIEEALLGAAATEPSDIDALSDGRPVEETFAPYGEGLPGGYNRRKPSDYDANLCLVPRDVLDFIYATQPKEWARLKQHYGEEIKDQFLRRLAREIDRRGTLDVLRNGIKDRGCRFRLAHFRPSSGLNEALEKLYEANLFAIIRQLRYSTRDDERERRKSLDLAIFLNGIPIFTAELKNPLTGQRVQDAIHQYRTRRDPTEPLFAFGRCLAHFAVDPDLVFVSTRLEGRDTRFLPLNQGKFGGAGNPPVPEGYATAYLWERMWARDSVLNLIQHFIHMVDEVDERGRPTGGRWMIFPRYHQLDAVRRLVQDARERGPGRSYLVQHSAGSGKSNSIAWLAHQLSVLHNADDRRVFDSIVVITDRRILDQQLQGVVKQFEQTLGVVENIDTTSKKLKAALEEGKTIVVTTLQKFPVIVEEIQQLAGQRFAVIIDEAHSSQSGETSRSMRAVLAAEDLEEAAEADAAAGAEDELQDRIVSEVKKRGKLPNVSTFAFTATPKRKTLELFGTRQSDGSYEAFSLYTMRQAIEEGFILDVLENYTTYRVYWSLLKKIEDDPHYDRQKATYLLRSFVDLHEHAIRKKVEIVVEHFAARVADRIDGRAKAMIVTRSRLHAVRYKLAVDRYLKERGLPHQALVAFSGTVRDGGIDYTETAMNGFPESQTATAFKRPENRLLIVANKFQTGFDEPLLHTMYVDKKLGGVNAVQTLSRLNRTHPNKNETMVLDFANEAEEIQAAFAPYYEKTILSEGTDPNLLYDLERDLFGYDVFTAEDVDAFARVWFDRKRTQDQLYSALDGAEARYQGLAEERQREFRGRLGEYARLYAFLSQVMPFADADLEKLYVFARMLRRSLPVPDDELPREVVQKIDMQSYRLSITGDAEQIELQRGTGDLDPIGHGAVFGREEEIEPLSRIVEELNARFGTAFTEDDKVFIRELESRLAGDQALTASVRVNAPENARLTFDHVVTDRLQDMMNRNFKFYKRVTDDRQFAQFFLDWLFDRFRKAALGEGRETAEGTE